MLQDSRLGVFLQTRRRRRRLHRRHCRRCRRRRRRRDNQPQSICRWKERLENREMVAVFFCAKIPRLFDWEEDPLWIHDGDNKLPLVCCNRQPID